MINATTITTNQKLSTVIHFFPGLYESWLSFDSVYSFDIEGDDYGDDQYVLPENWYDLVDYEQYANDISELYVKFVNDLSPESVKLDFTDICSPEQYNFSTDRLFCNINCEGINELVNFAKDHLDQFKTHIIDKYTSRSGFISYYETDINTWLDKDITALDHNEIGTYLEFYLITEYDKRILEDITNDCVEYMCGNSSIYSYLPTTTTD